EAGPLPRRPSEDECAEVLSARRIDETLRCGGSRDIADWRYQRGQSRDQFRDVAGIPRWFNTGSARDDASTVRVGRLLPARFHQPGYRPGSRGQLAWQAGVVRKSELAHLQFLYLGIVRRHAIFTLAHKRGGR